MSWNNIIPFDCIEGGVHKTSPVEAAPEVILTEWSVVELPDGKRHFIGWNKIDGEGRVSSAIVSYDKETKIAKTNSGRTYKLLGESGFNRDASYVWGVWMLINNVTDFRDVSEEY